MWLVLSLFLLASLVLEDTFLEVVQLLVISIAVLIVQSMGLLIIVDFFLHLIAVRLVDSCGLKICHQTYNVRDNVNLMYATMHAQTFSFLC